MTHEQRGDRLFVPVPHTLLPLVETTKLCYHPAHTTCWYLRSSETLLGKTDKSTLRMGLVTEKCNCEKNRREVALTLPGRGYNLHTSSPWYPSSALLTVAGDDAGRPETSRHSGHAHSIAFCHPSPHSLTCKVWLKRFNGVVFTGGMRFASDVTLERGLTLLLLGSCRVRKENRGQC